MPTSAITVVSFFIMFIRSRDRRFFTRLKVSRIPTNTYIVLMHFNVPTVPLSFIVLPDINVLKVLLLLV